MNPIRIGSVALLIATAAVAGCRQPQDGTGEQGVPAGAVPAAPDVRPGTESAPGGAAPAGAEGSAGDRAVPSDTTAAGAAVGGDTATAPRP